MSIITSLVPARYKVLRMGLQQNGGGVVAVYDVQILNADGQPVGVVHPTSTLTPAEKTAITAMFTRDRAAFEAATGLTVWIDL